MQTEQDALIATALRYARAGFLVHPLYNTTVPFRGYQETSTRDPDEVTRQFSHPHAAGVGYLLGNGTLLGKDELGHETLYDLIAIDIDDGKTGLRQLHMLTREMQGEWAKRPGREHVERGFPEDFKSGVPAPLPKTMTIRTPSGNEQRVYRVHRGPDDDDWIIGCRLDTSLELKAASKDGAPISGRLPPTFRPGTEKKPGGPYIFGERMLPAVLPWPWEEHFQRSAKEIRDRNDGVRETEPPKHVGQYEHDQASRVLRAACKRIAGTRVGRRMTINNEALFCGHLAWAFPNEETAVQSLIRAARKTHWHGDIEKTVRAAFQDGAKVPRDVRRSTLHRSDTRSRKRIDEPLNFGDRP